MAETSGCTGLLLLLALSYSSRWEITEAVRRLAARAAEGALDPAQITEETLSQAMTTAAVPDPDLLIRTGGDMRISNFLLYQIAYTELVFTSTYWPDYSRAEFRNHIAEFQRRQRRFGLTGEQILDS